MVPSSGVPTDHSSRWVTSPVVFPEDPSLALMSPLAESFHPPSRRVSQDCLNLGDSLALEELWIDQDILDRGQLCPIRDQTSTPGRLTVVPFCKESYPASATLAW